MKKLENNGLENVSGGSSPSKNLKLPAAYKKLIADCESSLGNFQKMREKLSIAYNNPDLTETQKAKIWKCLENLMNATENMAQNKIKAQNIINELKSAK